MSRYATAWVVVLALILFVALFTIYAFNPDLVEGSEPERKCVPEAASQWAPAGFICDPIYGDGWASMWGGPGAATNSCVYPWKDCQTIAVTSLETGITIIVTPTTWCHCWANVTGPNGETERLVDLDPGHVAALGLDPDLPTLHRVHVEPVREEASSHTLLPNTAMEVQP